MTREEFTKNITALGIKKNEVIDQQAPFASTRKITFFFETIDGVKLIFRGRYDPDAYASLTKTPKEMMYDMAFDSLIVELQMLLLQEGRIDDFIKQYGWDRLEELAETYPNVQKWLAAPR